MKKPFLYILPFLLLSSPAWAKTENTYYSDYLGQCSQSDIKHYSLKSEGLQGKEYNEVDIFESTQLDVDCLAEKFVHHHLENKSQPGGFVNLKDPELQRKYFDAIIQKKETVNLINNAVVFERIEITSLFSEVCVEGCYLSREAILINKGRYWYVRGSNDYGLEAEFVNQDTILIKNSNSTHVRNYVFNVNTKDFTWMQNGKIEFKKDHYIVRQQKSYFSGGGAYWFDSKRSYEDGRIIDFIDPPDDGTFPQVHCWKANATILKRDITDSLVKKYNLPELFKDDTEDFRQALIRKKIFCVGGM